MSCNLRRNKWLKKTNVIKNGNVANKSILKKIRISDTVRYSVG